MVLNLLLRNVFVVPTCREYRSFVFSLVFNKLEHISKMSVICGALIMNSNCTFGVP